VGEELSLPRKRITDVQDVVIPTFRCNGGDDEEDDDEEDEEEQRQQEEEEEEEPVWTAPEHPGTKIVLLTDSRGDVPERAYLWHV
jgi:hypothetical protein